MSILRIELDVEMVDGSTFGVVTGQRDFAKLEVHMKEISDPFARRPVASLRYLAWTAATRQQLTTLSWEDFDEQLEEAMPADEEDGAADDESLDPGQPAVSASPSSSSGDTRARSSSRTTKTSGASAT